MNGTDRHDAQMLSRRLAKERGHRIGKISQSGNSGLNYNAFCKNCGKVCGCKFDANSHGWIPYGKALIENCNQFLGD